MHEIYKELVKLGNRATELKLTWNTFTIENPTDYIYRWKKFILA